MFVRILQTSMAELDTIEPLMFIDIAVSGKTILHHKKKTLTIKYVFFMFSKS